MSTKRINAKAKKKCGGGDEQMNKVRQQIENNKHDSVRHTDVMRHKMVLRGGRTARHGFISFRVRVCATAIHFVC